MRANRKAAQGVGGASSSTSGAGNERPESQPPHTLEDMADEAVQHAAAKDGSQPVSISGDCYDSHQMTVLLHVTNAELTQLQEARRVLGLECADRTTLFPKDQFDLKRPVVVEGLADVLAAIRYVPPDEWQVLAWLRTPRPELDGKSVLDHLKCGGSVAAAVGLARNWSGATPGFTGF